MLTNIFPTLKIPYVQTVTNIPFVLNLIKTGFTKEKVCEARPYGKEHSIFKEIKRQVPTFTPNGSFNKYRCTKNIQSITGLIYMDVDDDTSPDFFHQLPFVHSCWRSFSGKRLTVLVSVSGLTIELFTHSWTYLYNHFTDLNIKIDKKTKDICRQCIISFDPDIYINPEPVPLVIPFPEISISLNISSPTIPVKYFSTSTSSEKIKYKTVLDDYKGQDYIVFEDGMDYRNTYLPRKIFTGERHKWISSFTSTMIFNNSSISSERLLIEVQRVNRDHCLPILSVEEVTSIVKWTYDKFINQSLIIQTKKKKIWINPEAKLSTKEKRTIIGKETGIIRKGRTIKELANLYLLLQQTNQKVTQKLLQSHSKVSIRTIKRHWKDVMEKVSFMNR